MKIKNTKIFVPVEVTEALREQYQALSLNDDQARVISSNTTTRIFIKQPGQLDTGTDSTLG